jgi:hypothetical protein
MPDDLLIQVRTFQWNGRSTAASTTMIEAADGRRIEVPTFVNEFWTSRQRAAHSLHEISYRACFKPQLPRFFIDRLTAPGDVVYDPFAGRGTTPLEAALAGRVPIANDINPLSAILLAPRLRPPSAEAVRERLNSLDLSRPQDVPEDLLTFYHADTLHELCALREYFIRRQAAGLLDAVDAWIRMVAVNRLTGHSSGFFSVYTLPPNQATSVTAQCRINTRRGQVPPRRDVRAILLKKTRSLLRDGAIAPALAGPPCILTCPAHDTPAIEDESVALVVTSPPFLNVVNYKGDNWLRCWFCGIDPNDVRLTNLQDVGAWQARMVQVFDELHRVLKPGGHVAFEVGEVRKGEVQLEDAVLPAGIAAGLQPVLVLINTQRFTKTANVWGVANNRLGTNTNRIVVFAKG